MKSSWTSLIGPLCDQVVLAVPAPSVQSLSNTCFKTLATAVTCMATEGDYLYSAVNCLDRPRLQDSGYMNTAHCIFCLSTDAKNMSPHFLHHKNYYMTLCI